LVSRHTPASAEWEQFHDWWSGIFWWQAPRLVVEVFPGTYRLEVSSPMNEGKYQLVIGSDKPYQGYLATWQEIRAVRDFAGAAAGPVWGVGFYLAHVAVVVVLGGAGYVVYRRLRRAPVSPPGV
jgi:hypothetical protein